MKCSRCYISIPPGQEIQKRNLGARNCLLKMCRYSRQTKKCDFWIILIGIWVLALVVPLIILWWKK